MYVYICMENLGRIITDIAAGEEVYVDYGKWYWAGSKTLPSRLKVKI